MKSFLTLLAASVFLLAGCAAPQPRARPSDPALQPAFDALNPGGPVFAPHEFIVTHPMPSEPPFGRYFADDRTSTPASLADPYWVTGYWAWKRSDWEWITGRWVERPRPGVIWINARSYDSGGRHYWRTGYWE